MSTPWSPRAILAIWNDCAPGRDDVYEHWYQTEHLRERVSISGFRVGRRYEAIQADRRFLTTYEADRADVLTSADYLTRLAHPTELTRAVMSNGFTNASRTICERRRVRGAIRGATVLTVTVDSQNAAAALNEVAVGAEVTHSELWASVHPPIQSESAEVALRGPDDTIVAGLALEFLREPDALDTAARLRSQVPEGDVGVYRLLCSLRKDDLACASS